MQYLFFESTLEEFLFFNVILNKSNNFNLTLTT